MARPSTPSSLGARARERKAETAWFATPAAGINPGVQVCRTPSFPCAQRSVRVEPAPALPAEPPGSDHFLQLGRRPIFRVVEVGVEHVHHGEQDVETDHVGQRERSDRMVAAELHAVVDLLRGGEPLL